MDLSDSDAEPEPASADDRKSKNLKPQPEPEFRLPAVPEEATQPIVKNGKFCDVTWPLANATINIVRCNYRIVITGTTRFNYT